MDKNGLTAFHYAIIFKKVDIMKFLLDSGAKANCGQQGMVSPQLPFLNPTPFEGWMSSLQLAILSSTPFKEAIEKLSANIDEVIAERPLYLVNNWLRKKIAKIIFCV